MRTPRWRMPACATARVERVTQQNATLDKNKNESNLAIRENEIGLRPQLIPPRYVPSSIKVTHHFPYNLYEYQG